MRFHGQTTGATAWGLDAAPDGGWWARARCAKPDVHSDLFAQLSESAAEIALHICHTHCPVLEQCAADAEREPPQWGGVYGGIFWASSGTGHRSRRRRSRQEPADWCALCYGGIVTSHPKKTVAQCGTLSGSRRHRHLGEPTCAACLAVEREYHRQRNLRRKEARTQ